MRITKKLLREIRVRFDERIKGTFKLTDVELGAFLKSMWPNVILGTREENTKSILLLSVNEFIPDYMIM